jgi:hypothetical protein
MLDAKSFIDKKMMMMMMIADVFINKNNTIK